jgi:hypothetical protein
MSSRRRGIDSSLESFRRDIADTGHGIALEDLNGNAFGGDFEYMSRNGILCFSASGLAGDPENGLPDRKSWWHRGGGGLGSDGPPSRSWN